MPRKPSFSFPTAGEILSLYHTKSKDGDEARLRGLARSFRLLTKMEHQVAVPEQYKAITQVIRTPYIRDAWLRVTAALVQQEPLTHIEPRNQTDEARRAANIAERWDNAAVRQLALDLGEDVIYEDAKALVRDGESVLKAVHRPDAWANFPKREKGELADEYLKRTDHYTKGAPLPFAWRSVDRLSMLFGDGEFGDDWALEYGEYPTPWLKRRYGMETTVVDSQDRLVDPAYLLGGRPKPEGELASTAGQATKVEYIDAESWSVVIDGSMAPGFPRENPYAPDLCYFRAKCPDSEPMLYSLLFLVPGLDALLTMKMNWSHLGAYPNPTLKPIAGFLNAAMEAGQGEDLLPSSFVWTPGKLMVPPLGYEFGFTSPPPVGQDINEMAIILRQLIDLAGIPSVFRGIGGSDQPGYAIAQLMAAANLAFKMAAMAEQRKFSKVLEFFHRIVARRIRNTVYVLGAASSEKGAPVTYLGLKPKGSVTASEAPVNLLGPVQFRFRPILPTDEQTRAMIAMQLVNAPKSLLSRKRALEKYLQEEDPEGVLDEIYVEEAVDNDPEIAARVREKALRNANLLPPANPVPTLFGPTGQPLAPTPPGQLPGQVAAGLPGVPGLNMPLQPRAPAGPPLTHGGGRPAGSYPGRPSGPREGAPA